MSFKFNKQEILKIQRNKGQYLMMDEAYNVVPKTCAESKKFLPSDEWFFKIHWEGDPNMPGMLQIEALVQTAALAILSIKGNEGKYMYLTKVFNANFFKKVTPENIFTSKTIIKSYKNGVANCQGKGIVNNQIVCKSEYQIILPDELKKFVPNLGK